MSTAIVIRSHAPDFPWLNYCLRSIQKFATGFSEVIIMVPESQAHLLAHLTAETVVPVFDGQPGYLCQQRDKLNADMHTKADAILHFDSDMIFTKPVTPAFFFRDGKPIWVVTPFKDKEMRAWLHVMVKCLHQMPPYEFMRKCAVVAPRWIYAEFRQFFKSYHGMTMDDYVMNQPGHEFSEYNCLGFFAWLNFRDKFYWHDTEIEGCDWPFRQFWSHSGTKHEGHLGPMAQERDELEETLK